MEMHRSETFCHAFVMRKSPNSFSVVPLTGMNAVVLNSSEFEQYTD
jgi:hypothetical protein